MHHVSQGEKEYRCILISKVKTDTAAESEEHDIKTERKINTLLTTQKSIEMKHNSETKQHVKQPKSKKSNSKQTLKAKVPAMKTEVEKTDEDFDILLAEVVKADKTCCFEKCKKSIAILSQVCQFCSGRFCFNHFIPEAHGCGHLAKLHARSQIRKEGKLYAGSGKPEKKVDPVKHSYLQKKLSEKINTMTNQRKTKSKN